MTTGPTLRRNPGLDVKRRLLAAQAEILMAKQSGTKKPSLIQVISLYFLKTLQYFLEKPLREQVGISKPMNPAHAKKIIVEVSKECYQKYCQKKELKKRALLENLHKVFLQMLKEARERISMPEMPKDGIIPNADEIKKE